MTITTQRKGRNLPAPVHVPRRAFYQAGVTLLELMITLAIMSVVLVIVVPSGQSIVIQNRIVGEINEISAIVQFARNHAIDEQIDTIVCPAGDFATCENDWDKPKIVFADLDGDGDRGDDEEILAGTSLVSNANDLTGPAGVIRFQANGSVSSPATLLLCHKDKDDKYARALTISLQGRVRISRDSNNDGIHENNTGAALDCS